MDFFEPMVREGYEWINCVNQLDYEVFVGFDGSSRRATWKPIPVRRVRADEHHDFKSSDFPWLGSDALVMRRSAVDALRDILDANGEVLPRPTDDDGVELFVLNARVIDALDEAKSSLMKFPGTDRIMRIQKVAFVASKVEGVDLFRLPHRASSTYVSERFVERVTAAPACAAWSSPRSGRDDAWFTPPVAEPPLAAAPHGAAGKAGPARAALEKFGIGINDAANGVFLQNGVHSGIHTNAYYDAVNTALQRATTREEALGALNAIRQGLLNGEFP